MEDRTIIISTKKKEKCHCNSFSNIGVWSWLRMMTMDSREPSACASSVNDWITMETQEEEDEISSNDIMAALFRADMLSHSATGQVASIFIRGRNLIYTRSSVTNLSLSQMPPDIYVYCLILPSGGLIRSRMNTISIQASCWEEKRDKVS